MTKGFFITGTDTGVGKTIVAAALIRFLRWMGFSVCAMKPVESGCVRKGGAPVPSDGIFLRDAAGMSLDISEVTPYALEAPLAPMVASNLEGVRIEPERIKRIFSGLAEKYDAAVVEGVGGLLVPIRRDYFVLDLIVDLGLPVVIVARPGLGTINHTLLTLRCALGAGARVAGIVINHPEEADGPGKAAADGLALRTNPDVLRQLAGVPIIGVFPHLAETSGPALERAAAASLDRDRLMSFF
ncbi:MAG: dethiobiotin synthase [Nitrospiraceae bacterium]|nr:dethiobiotin synthase [Nitrospiraceae bacterium]